MPEGDSIHRAASRVRPVLVGAPISEAKATKASIPAARLVGRAVSSVDTHGKNLFLRFDRLGSLRVHLGMDGRILLRRAPPPFPPRAPVHLLLLRAGAIWFICRAPKILEWEAPTIAGDPRVRVTERSSDLLAPHDPAALARALAADGNVPIASALLRQGIMAGIGNVYKSEVLFRERIHPETLVGDLSLADLERLISSAAWLLARNVGSLERRRITRFGLGPKLAVYERGGEPCLRCGARIVRTVDREGARSTYHCPSCQKRTTTAIR